MITCHYCDSFGFEQLADFISQKPTVAELEAQVKKGQKKSVVAQLKSQPTQERKKTAPKKSAEKER